MNLTVQHLEVITEFYETKKVEEIYGPLVQQIKLSAKRRLLRIQSFQNASTFLKNLKEESEVNEPPTHSQRQKAASSYVKEDYEETTKKAKMELNKLKKIQKPKMVSKTTNDETLLH